jgi:YbbR domain-containing protein
VRFTNMDALAARNLATAGELDYTIDVLVEGTRVDTGKLTPEDFTATADLLGWQKGEQSIPVDLTGPGSVGLLERRPARITVLIEDLISVNKPIRIEFSEAFPQNREAGFISTAPNEIEVTGAKSLVDSVAYIRVPVQSGDLRDTIRTFNVAAQPMNAEGEAVEAPLKLSQSEVEVTAMLCYVRQTPLDVEIVGDVDPMLEVTSLTVPEFVRIKGTESAVNRVRALTAAPVDISGVDVTSNIPLFIDLPEGVELTEASAHAAVSIQIKGIATKTFQFASNEIAVDGITENYSAYINTGDVTVVVFGTDSVISGFEKNDLRLYVDLSEWGPLREDAEVSETGRRGNAEDSETGRREDAIALAGVGTGPGIGTEAAVGEAPPPATPAPSGNAASTTTPAPSGNPAASGNTTPTGGAAAPPENASEEEGVTELSGADLLLHITYEKELRRVTVTPETVRVKIYETAAPAAPTVETPGTEQTGG